MYTYQWKRIFFISLFIRKRFSRIFFSFLFFRLLFKFYFWLCKQTEFFLWNALAWKFFLQLIFLFPSSIETNEKNIESNSKKWESLVCHVQRNFSISQRNFLWKLSSNSHQNEHICSANSSNFLLYSFISIFSQFMCIEDRGFSINCFPSSFIFLIRIKRNQNLWNQDLWRIGKACELWTNKNLYIFNNSAGSRTKKK